MGLKSVGGLTMAKPKPKPKKWRICQWCGDPHQNVRFCGQRCLERFMEKEKDESAPTPEEIAERCEEVKRKHMEKKRGESEWKHQFEARDGATVRVYSWINQGWEAV